MSVIEKARPGRPGGPIRRPSRGRRRALAFALVAGVAAATAFWWLRARDPALPIAPAPAQPSATEAPPLGAARRPEPHAPAPGPAREPAPAVPLPALAESDAFARELARSVSADGLLAAALREAGVVERFVVIVDQLAEGNVPRRELDFLRPKGGFLVIGGEAEPRVDPASYHRYDAFAAAFAKLDARAAVAAYRRLAPLCEEAYRALGYPEGGFEARLRAALALLARAPAGEASPALVAHVKRWEFGDPELESLPAVQKQLLRMGPENGERVRAKARELESELERSL